MTTRVHDSAGNFDIFVPGADGDSYGVTGTLSVVTAKTGCVRFKTPATDHANAAFYLMNMGNANADLTFTAVTAGSAGNDIAVVLTDPGELNATIDVVVAAGVISVALATNAGLAIISTANDVKTAIEASAAASALVTVAVEGTGLGVVNAFSQVNLEYGAEPHSIHLRPIKLLSTYVVTATLKENSTVTGTEVDIEPRNRNRSADDDASVEVHYCADATVGSSDADLDVMVVPANVQMSLGVSERIVLKPETDYVLALANASGSTAAITYGLFWTEEV